MLWQWEMSEFTVKYPKSGDVPVKVYWREPLNFVKDLLSDTSLMQDSHFYPQRKSLHTRDAFERMIDEPWTADEWWENMVCARLTVSSHLLNRKQDQLPEDNPAVRHCYLPLHIWLDQGQVSRRVQMYPIVLRGGWISSLVRNGSGNGGGILIGFMPMVSALLSPTSLSS
jgi:hypothetical protein